MRPLRRDTTDTRADELAKRIEVLERRYIVPEAGLPWGRMLNTTGQLVTANEQLDFDSLDTNDDTVFTWDSVGDPAGMLVHRDGMFMVLADIWFQASDIAVHREIYTQAARLNSGISFGNELAPAIGSGQNASGIGTVNATPTLISKVRLSHFALVRMSHLGFPVPGLDTNPWRFNVVLDHTGTNFNVSGTATSVLTVVWLGVL